MGIKPKEN